MKTFSELMNEFKKMKNDPCWDNYKMVGTKKKNGKTVPNCVPEENELQEKRKGLWHNIHAKRKRGERPAKPGEKGYPKTLDIDEARGEDSKGHFRSTESGAGMTKKGVEAHRRANPGSKLQTAVTGKVKPGSKAAKRRKSFCARMSGMKGPMKDEKGRPTRKAMSLKRWRC